MTAIDPASKIEAIVGAKRHPTRHIARAVSAEQTVYVLHPESCRRLHEDLRNCKYSRALDNGIEKVSAAWMHVQDKPVVVDVFGDYLLPRTELPETNGGDE